MTDNKKLVPRKEKSLSSKHALIQLRNTKSPSILKAVLCGIRINYTTLRQSQPKKEFLIS
jgi:hypothetical protein